MLGFLCRIGSSCTGGSATTFSRGSTIAVLSIVSALGLTALKAHPQQPTPPTVPSQAVSIQKKDDAADKKTLPIRLTVTGKAAYTLDTGGLPPAEYRKKVEKSSQDGRPMPTPAVELTVEIANISDKPVQVWTSGDPVVLLLKLEGPGALNLSPPLAFTREFRLPKAETLAPGQVVTFRITELTSGFRGRSHFAYWTEPGEYKLICTLTTGIKPAPPGTPGGMDGFGRIQLQSEPLVITVKSKPQP